MTDIETRIESRVAVTPDGEVLVTIYPTGMVTVAFRPDRYATWGVPYTAEARP